MCKTNKKTRRYITSLLHHKMPYRSRESWISKNKLIVDFEGRNETMYDRISMLLKPKIPNYMYREPNEMQKKVQCVVPENIHTPTTEGIGNSEGEGAQRPMKFQRGGGL